jgi:hypothetical protein
LKNYTLTQEQWDVMNKALSYGKTCAEEPHCVSASPNFRAAANDAIERGIQTLVNLPAASDVALSAGDCGSTVREGAGEPQVISKETLAPKDVEKIYVASVGDPSVGLFSSGFEASVWIPKGCDVEETRQRMIELYEDMVGDDVTALFDFELEARDRQEREMEEAHERDERSLP